MLRIIAMSMLGLFIAANFVAATAFAAVKIEKTEYRGWPNCYRVSNGDIELIVAVLITSGAEH